MRILPEMAGLGTPSNQIETPQGTILFWSNAPFLATHMEGYADITIGQAIDDFYRKHFDIFDFVVTVHDWSALTDYDWECRKLMQQLTHFMRPKQRELILHLGKQRSYGHKAILVAAEIMTKMRGTPFEFFNDDEMFESRLRGLKEKYGH